MFFDLFPAVTRVHCFIFLVSIVKVIFLNNLDTIEIFLEKNITLHLDQMDPDPTRSGSTTLHFLLTDLLGQIVLLII
jgi:hypothetical protein